MNLKMIIEKKYDKDGNTICQDVARGVWKAELSAKDWIRGLIDIVKGEMPVSECWVFDSVTLVRFDDKPDVYGKEHEASRSYEIVDCFYDDEES